MTDSLTDAEVAKASLIALPISFDTGDLQQLLLDQKFWNERDERRRKGPHRFTQDCWARYIDRSLLEHHDYTKPFPFEWYFDELREAMEPIANKLMNLVGGTSLGGQLVTCKPPGMCVLAHDDTAYNTWHAHHFHKFGIQIYGDIHQGFCTDEHRISLSTGKVWWFNNHRTHYVYNCSELDCVTWVCCIEIPGLPLDTIPLIKRASPGAG